MMLRRVGRWAVIGAAVILAAGVAAAAFAMKNLLSGKTGGPVQAVSAPAEVVTRGKYLAEAADFAISAKTFRTWGGSLAAFNRAILILGNGEVPTRKSLCDAAAVELHNTPAICRKSYVHPTVLALSEAKSDPVGWFKRWKRRRLPHVRGLRADENALLALLRANSR